MAGHTPKARNPSWIANGELTQEERRILTAKVQATELALEQSEQRCAALHAQVMINKDQLQGSLTNDHLDNGELPQLSLLELLQEKDEVIAAQKAQMHLLEVSYDELKLRRACVNMEYIKNTLQALLLRVPAQTNLIEEKFQLLMTILGFSVFEKQQLRESREAILPASPSRKRGWFTSRH